MSSSSTAVRIFHFHLHRLPMHVRRVRTAGACTGCTLCVGQGQGRGHACLRMAVLESGAISHGLVICVGALSLHDRTCGRRADLPSTRRRRRHLRARRSRMPVPSLPAASRHGVTVRLRHAGDDAAAAEAEALPTWQLIIAPVTERQPCRCNPSLKAQLRL